ncbi:MAG: cytochrome C oxidase subunit IV family protein [Chloroflexi bacterium]|nr:cytochrome C oxidase subunit IV family protein [Chloroflexota bacterium]
MSHQPQTTHAPNRNRLYVITFLALGILTMVEFAASNLPAFKLPVLLVLAATKASLVAGIYMHLKFDSRAFTTLVAMGLFCAVILVGAFSVVLNIHFD